VILSDVMMMMLMLMMMMTMTMTVMMMVMVMVMVMMMMMMMDELSFTWHIVLRLQGHVTVKKESRNSRRVS